MPNMQIRLTAQQYEHWKIYAAATGQNVAAAIQGGGTVLVEKDESLSTSLPDIFTKQELQAFGKDEIIRIGNLRNFDMTRAETKVELIVRFLKLQTPFEKAPKTTPTVKD